MRVRTSIVCLLAWSCLVPPRFASGADNPADEIARFVNEQTLAVARVDVTRADFDAVEQWAQNILAQSKLSEGERKDLSPKLRETLASGKQWAQQFKQAGGRSIWAVFTLETFPQTAPVFFVVPLQRDSDVNALRALFGDDAGKPAPRDRYFDTRRIGDALVCVKAEVDKPALDVIGAIRAQPRPELTKALAEAGDAPLQMLLIPTADARKVVESMVPPMPDGHSITDLTRGLVWAAAGVRFPPDASAHFVVQSESHDAAAALQGLLKATLRTAQEQHGNASGDPVAARAMSAVLAAAMRAADQSRVENDRVVVDLNRNDLTTEVADLATALHGARERSARIVSMSHERQLLLGCVMYADQHQGQFPPSLDEAAKQADATGALVDPQRPDQRPGYRYVKPAAGTKTPSDRLVLYEAFGQFGDGVSVGFADGHVEWVGDEAHFQQLLKAAQEAQARP
jgi:hypothetical protein